MLISRRADTRARADFATWKMMAKLNGASALPHEAQAFLESYKVLLRQMSEPDATEATIKLVYKAYYNEMGGAGVPPVLPVNPSRPVTDNVTAFKRPANPRPNVVRQAGSPRPTTGPLPVALIFGCLVLVYVGIRYFLV
jgi:hypothetical protein